MFAEQHIISYLFRFFLAVNLFVLIWPVVPRTCFADAMFRYKVIDNFPDGFQQERAEEIWVRENLYRVRHVKGGGQVVNLNAGHILFIDHEKKEYTATEFKELKDRLGSVHEKLRSQFANDFMGADAVDPSNEQFIRREILDQQKEIGGYACRYVIFKTPLKSVEAWVSSEVEGSADLKMFLRTMHLIHPDIPFLTDLFELETALLEEGFPVQVVTKLHGVQGVTFIEEKRLVEVNADTLDDSIFLPPSDYKEVPADKSPLYL